MLDIDNLIKVNNYVAIRSRDGIDALKRIIHKNHSAYMAAVVLDRIQDSDYA